MSDPKRRLFGAHPFRPHRWVKTVDWYGDRFECARPGCEKHQPRWMTADPALVTCPGRGGAL